MNKFVLLGVAALMSLALANPSNGNIRINSNMALPYNIEVFDLSGRKVQDMKMFQNNTDINLENLAKGAYQIRVSNNYNSVRETVIIK